MNITTTQQLIRMSCLAMSAIIGTHFVGLAYSQSSDCKTKMQLHGFLKRAQFQCNYRYYSNNMTDNVKRCSQTLQDNQLEELISEGMIAFDKNTEERGLEKLCQDVLRDFPSIVRNVAAGQKNLESSAPINLKSSALLKGDCKTELNGHDAGCSGVQRILSF